jgi:diguanylate cyclase
MRYHENTEQSAEYLRLALQRMARQDAGLHPVSYALWYEYVAGINPALKAEVDALTQDGGRLSEESTYALYRKHIAELDAEASRRISTSVQHIVAQVSESAAQAGDRASRFGNALERWSGALAQPQAGTGTLAAVKDVLRDTREEALVDALTGLSNRTGFDLAIDACLSKAPPGTPGLCLLMADIDHFKRINDAYGHLFGDKVLRAIGQALKANVKGKDTAARYGGEEFAVLLPETPLAGAVKGAVSQWAETPTRQLSLLLVAVGAVVIRPT